MSKDLITLRMVAAIGCAALGTGIVLGAVIALKLHPYVDKQQAIAEGRLSACNDIVGVLNSSAPVELKCSLEKGIVYISSDLAPGKVTLDGKLVD